LKSGLARRVDPGPGTRDWNWAKLKKKRGKEKPNVTRLTWRVDPARPGPKPGCNSLTMFYIFYQNNVVLSYKKMGLTRVTRSKPMTALSEVDHRAKFKNTD
jgi:hypothetical protein